MQDNAIQWGAIAIFGSVMLGILLVNVHLKWREKQRRRRSRGFRNMKSVAQKQRERGHMQARWQEPMHGTQRGWR